MKPMIVNGRFVFCSTCNLLVDTDGNAIPNTHTDAAEQDLLEMKVTDCVACQQTKKWKALSISKDITLSASLHNQINMAAWRNPAASATV